MPKYDWAGLMTKWNTALLDSSLREYLPDEAVESSWIGAVGATDDEITVLEAKLGKQLPTSYREFLQFSNGWANVTSFIDNLWSTRDVDWFSVRNQDWIDAWNPEYDDLPPVSDEEYLRYDDEQMGALRPEYMKTALEISDVGDSAIFLLNPQIVTEDGEWEAWFLANWMAGARRYPSFWEMMSAEYQHFLNLEADKRKEDAREAIITNTTQPSGDKIQTALEMVRERIQVFEQMESSQADTMGAIYPQGILEALHYAEMELMAIRRLSPADHPTRFEALVEDLYARWQSAHTTSRDGMNTADMLGILMRQPTMDDLANLMGRLSGALNGEGYRMAWETLRQVKF